MRLITTPSSPDDVPVSVARSQKQRVQARAGTAQQLQFAADPDISAVGIKKGKNLKIRLKDGAELEILNFFNIEQGPTRIELPGSPDPVWLEVTASGVPLSDDSELVYVYGDKQDLAIWLMDEPELAAAVQSLWLAPTSASATASASAWGLWVAPATESSALVAPAAFGALNTGLAAGGVALSASAVVDVIQGGPGALARAPIEELANPLSQSAGGHALGFTVVEGVMPSVTINGTPVNVADYFSKSTVDGRDVYLALQGKFAGTETVVVRVNELSPEGVAEVGALTLKSIDTSAPAGIEIKPRADADNADYDGGFDVDTGAEVTLTVNGQSAELADYFDKTLDPDTGREVYTAKAGKLDGSETVTVQARLIDLAGNETSAQPVTLRKIDTTAPDAPLVTAVADPANADYAEGLTVSAGATINLNINGVNANWADFFALTPGTTGPDTYTAKPGVFDGSETIEITASRIDPGGNAATFPPAKLKIDTTAPAEPRVEVLQDPDNSSYGGGFKTDENATPWLQIDGKEVNWEDYFDKRTDPETGRDIYLPEPGKFTGIETVTLEVSVTDSAGNHATTTTPLKAIDTTVLAPEIQLLKDGGQGADHLTNDPSFSVDGIEAGARIEYRISKKDDQGNYSVVAEWSATYTPPATDGTADGSYRVEVRQTDPSGNRSVPKSIDFTLDATPPQVASAPTFLGGDNVINAKEADEGFWVIGQTDAELGQRLRVMMQGKAETARFVDVMAGTNGLNTWQAFFTKDDLPKDADGNLIQGSIGFDFDVLDAAGNWSDLGWTQPMMVDPKVGGFVVTNINAGKNTLNLATSNSTDVIVIAGNVGDSGIATLEWTDSAGVVRVTQTSTVEGTAGTWQIDLPVAELPLGGGKATLFFTDDHGNQSSAESFDFMVEFKPASALDVALTDGSNDVIDLAGLLQTTQALHVKNFEPFNDTSGDKLDLSKLLEGYTASSDLGDWLSVHHGAIGDVADNTVILVDKDGAGAGTALQSVQLEGIVITSLAQLQPLLILGA